MGVLRKLASTPRIVLLARPRGRSAAALLACALATSSFSSPLRAADEPLHERIDRLVEAAHSGAAAPIASDADFLRRAHLVLTGITPTAAQAREFLADKSEGKRAALIDRLIASREFTRWMALRFDVMLMERRGEVYVKRAPWRQYLEESFASNKPWHQLVRELLSADGADEKTRGIARWALEREGDPHLLTRDVARLFLGRDIACAQCHDHPRIDDYMQRDYYGLHAFVSRTHLFHPDQKKPALLAEHAEGEAAWTSVFTKISGSTKPRLPERDEIAEPTLAGADLWTVPPDKKDKNVRPIPKFSRRAQLAALLTDGDHPAFRRNIANRLWYIVFGRGLVEPLDLHHSANPPSNPALLDLLAETIAAGGFDMKKVIREIALTRTFQRAIDLPQPAPQLVGPIEEELPCFEEAAKALNEIAARSEEASTQARQTLMKAQREGEPFEAEAKKQTGAVAEAQKAADAAQAALKKAEEALAARSDAQRALTEAATKASEAAAKVPDAPELAAAAKTFETKAAQAGNEAAAAEKEATAKKAELAAKTEALTGAQTAAAAARTKVESVRTNIAKLQLVLDREAARKQRDRISARHAVRLAAEARALVAWAPVAAADQVARETAQRAETALASVRGTIDRLTAELMDGPAKIVALETAASTALAQIATSRDAVTQRSGSVASLAEAAAKSADAAAKLTKDAEVQTAAAAVKAKADAVATEVAALEKAAAEAPAKSKAANKALLDSRTALEKAAADLLLAQQQIPPLAGEAKTAREAAARTRQPATQAEEILATTWSETFGSLALYPLMPEQLCWSVMQATGLLDQQRAEAAAEWDKKNPLTDADKANPAKQAERTVAIENALSEKIRPHEDQYVRAFGGAAGQPQTDFFATPEQALYFENGGVLRSWSTNLSGRLASLAHSREMAEELYLSTLTRTPTDAEVQELTDAVAARPPEKKREALADLAWALITSAEFRFLH